MQKLNGIQLDPRSRREVARTALKIGACKTAKRYGIDPKTVLLWRRRLIEGGNFTNKCVSPMSSQEKRRILDFARKFGVGTINSFRKKHNIDRSVAAIYNLFVNSLLDREEIKMVIYSCLDCSRDFRAVALYWGIPIAPECPTCGGALSITRSYSPAFIGSLNALYSIRRGEIEQLAGSEIRSIRISHPLPKTTYPKFIDLVDGTERLTHILKAIGGGSNDFLCGLSSPSSRVVHPYSALSKIPVDIESLCPICEEAVNLLLSAGKSLKPVIKPSLIDKKESMREIVTMGVLSGNISKICAIYKLPRSTFYYNLSKFRRLRPGAFESIDLEKYLFARGQRKNSVYRPKSTNPQDL